MLPSYSCAYQIRRKLTLQTTFEIANWNLRQYSILLYSQQQRHLYICIHMYTHFNPIYAYHISVLFTFHDIHFIVLRNFHNFFPQLSIWDSSLHLNMKPTQKCVIILCISVSYRHADKYVILHCTDYIFVRG